MSEAPDPQFVFISYSRRDTEFVARLIADLQACGITCWIDKQGFQPGIPDWEQALRDAIRSSRGVLLMASPDSRQSRYVKAELNVTETYQRAVYPIWVAGDTWIDAIPFGLSTS